MATTFANLPAPSLSYIGQKPIPTTDRGFCYCNGTQWIPLDSNQPINANTAALPTSLVSTGQSALTQDNQEVIYNGNTWQPAVTPLSFIQQRRAANIAAFNLGAVVAAPNWAATTAYAVNQCVTLPTGQVLVCQTAGTSGATAPVYTTTSLNGRPYVDGSVTWSGTIIKNAPTGAVSADLIPTITLYTSAAAAGLTETQIGSGSGNSVFNPLVTLFGALPASGSGYQTSLAAFTWAPGNSGGTGNATGGAVAQGYSNANVYQVLNYDVELYITDSVVALTFPGNSTGNITIEVDGVTIMANPQIPTTNAGQCLVLNYNGIVKRRRVTWSGPAVANTIRGWAVSPSGFVEVTDSPLTDQMLIIGDSVVGTVASGFPASSNVINIGATLKRMLGISGVINTSTAGSGYLVANPNTYNALQVLQNSANQQLFSIYAPSHILFCMGFNDRQSPWAQVSANALASWQLARQLFPNAKITITDGFSQAAGPDSFGLTQAANLLALFNSWGDPNSRFVQSIGPTASSAWVQGTSYSTVAITAGNSSWVVGSGGTHSTGVGAAYQAQRMANAIIKAWNGNY